MSIRYKKWSLFDLLQIYVWGEEPFDSEELVERLKDKGISIEELRDDIDIIIDKYAGYDV